MILTPEIIPLFFILLSAAFVYALATRNFRLALIIFFVSLPLKSIYIVAGGFFLESWKLFSLLSLPYTIQVVFRPSPAVRSLVLYFAFSLLILACATFGLLGPELAATQVKHVVRSFGQVFQLLAFLNLALVPLVFSQGYSDSIMDATVWYVRTVLVVAVLGLVQYIYWVYSGINIFPVPRLDGEMTDAFLNYIGDLRVDGLLRVNSLSMEPKNLALYIVVAIIFVVERLRLGVERMGLVTVLTLIVFVVCLGLTLSTLGYVTISLYVGFSMLRLRSFLRILAIGSMLALLLYFSEGGQRLFELFLVRSVGRVSQGGIEDFDAGVLGFLLDHPIYILTGIGLGNTHMVAGPYLPDFAQWAASTTWHAKMGGLYVVAGSGIVGLGLLYHSIGSAWASARSLREDLLAEFVTRLLVFFALLFLLRNTEFLFLTLGMCIAVEANTITGRSAKSWQRMPDAGQALAVRERHSR